MTYSSNRLYCLNSHKVLAKILDCNIFELRKICKQPDFYYNVFEIKTVGKKPRIVQNPKPQLKKLHKKLKRILSDIILPGYVHSGAKGRSYKGNAQAHIGNKYVATMDIQQFFPNCSEKIVWQFFYKKFNMSPDVARTLAKLCCYNGHIPTGSPISLLLAYFSNVDVFDFIKKDADDNGYTFTLYVDDMTFSTNSKKISRTYHLYLNKLISKNGLNLKKDKIIYFHSNQDKLITGCKLSCNKTISASDKLKRKLFRPIKIKKMNQLNEKEIRSTIGRLNSIRYIEGDILKNLKDNLSTNLMKSLT